MDTLKEFFKIGAGPSSSHRSCQPAERPKNLGQGFLAGLLPFFFTGSVQVLFRHAVLPLVMFCGAWKHFHEDFPLIRRQPSPRVAHARHESPPGQPWL